MSSRSVYLLLIIVATISAELKVTRNFQVRQYKNNIMQFQNSVQEHQMFIIKQNYGKFLLQHQSLFTKYLDLQLGWRYCETSG